MVQSLAYPTHLGDKDKITDTFRKSLSSIVGSPMEWNPKASRELCGTSGEYVQCGNHGFFCTRMENLPCFHIHIVFCV